MPVVCNLAESTKIAGQATYISVFGLFQAVGTFVAMLIKTALKNDMDYKRPQGKQIICH